MTRTERLLRLARLRGDRLAIAVLEAKKGGCNHPVSAHGRAVCVWSESEMRAAWGDR